MVADALIYHPVVAHFNRHVATTVGRDKALRLLQYLSRFLAWYTYRTNHPATTVDIFKNTKKTFGNARKAMRLGKFVEHFKAAAVAVDAKNMDPVLRSLAISRQLGYGFYMLFDALAYVDTVGIYKFESAKTLTTEATRAWWVGIASNVVAGFYKLYNLHLQVSKNANSSDAEKAVELKKLQKEQAAVRLQLLSDCCDFTLPNASLGWVDLDDGVLGLAGTVSSIIGLRAAWNKTA